MAQTGLPRLQIPVEALLASLKAELEGELRRTNERILSGENTHVHVKKRGPQTTWTLPYPRSEEGINDPFFDGVEQIDIHTLMYFVHQQCRFLDVFEHILPRYAKQSAEEQVILACLVAWGTNLGLRRMDAISDIDFQSLTTASDNFVRPETLKPANDVVINAIAKLPIFHAYDIAEQVHSSSDGQKFETLIHTLNARHSSKYFGLKKGIVVITLIANHVPVNADIIGANEHESHYVFDLLYNNVNDVQPAVHSTDTHGANQVNFAILDFFGKQFAPRYQDIRGKVQNALYGFQHPSHYPDDWLLKPIRQVKEELVIREWDNVQRIIVSLALKTTTQSIIVSKLSAYERRNDTRQALWEYDNILASLYLLKYTDSPPLRRGVQQALNRGESYHQLHRAVSYANFGKLRFTTEYDQLLWSECSRLIANCIIFYNASILSALLLRNQERGDEDPAALLRHISPVAWQHINFYGRFEFASIPLLIDIAAIVQDIIARSMPPDSAQEL
jgi:TnpA family transposase